jgi:hypothetical protein
VSDKKSRARCRSCNKLAGVDGYCKNHRPEPERPNPFRDNFKDYGIGFKAPEDKKEFGALRDFGLKRKWG